MTCARYLFHRSTLPLLFVSLILLALPAQAVTPQVKVNGYRAMVLKSDGTVWAWGANGAGILGDGSTTNRPFPVQVSGLSNATAIEAGDYHSLALTADGSVWAWGFNGSGQLGNGGAASSSLPVRASGLTTVVGIAAGGYHSAAVKSDGTVWTWGLNEYGQIGDGTRTNRSSPVLVPGLTSVVAVAAGHYFTVALKSNGTVWAWGGSPSGAGEGGIPVNSPTPVQISGLTDIVAVAAGNDHAVVRSSGGTVWAWGRNGGALGNGSLVDSPVPVRVSGLVGASAIAAGGFNSAALKSDRSMWVWGSNLHWQLGNGNTTDFRSALPVQVSALTNVVAIATGGDDSAAIKSDGTVWAWGWNNVGQLGNGNTVDSSVPVQVRGPNGQGVLNVGTVPQDPDPPQGPEAPQVRPQPGVIQPQPEIEPVPPSPRTVNLVVIVHGFNATSDGWPTFTATGVRNQIAKARDQDPARLNDRWSVIAYDWRDAAGIDCVALNQRCVWDAYANAVDQGKRLGQMVAPVGYSRIHLIAHSTGSALVESAAAEILASSPTPRPVIHTTFLDAYHPFPEGAVYGMSSYWAEQYINKNDAVPNTNIKLPYAFNFDITSLVRPTDGSGPIDGHSWPHIWYRDTVESPDLWSYGWGSSYEWNAALPSHNLLARGGECAIVAPTTSCAAPTLTIRKLQFTAAANPFDPWLNPSTVAVSQSSTGTVSLSTPQRVSMTVGSPVWIRLAANVSEPMSALQFAYQFSGGDEGLLSVFLDDQLVFRADQRYAAGGLNQSGIVPLGEVGGGVHSLAFRLDHFSASKPTVTISEIKVGVTQVVEATNVAPIADAGVDQTVAAGSVVQLNGVGSRDPDNAPLPLVWEWSQTGGPPVTLTGAASSTPTFTPASAGTYIFSLIVHDGQQPSVPGTVRVTANGATVADGSPPLVTPSVTGTFSASGWYTSDVQVSWTVNDPESSITAQSGCASVTVNMDTAGAVYTCTATSVGGSTSQSVTVKRDATGPIIAVSVPAGAASFTQNSAVTASYTCSDPMTGIVRCSGTVANGSAVDTSTTGTKTFSVTATDAVGNTSTAQTTYQVTASGGSSTGKGGGGGGALSPWVLLMLGTLAQRGYRRRRPQIMFADSNRSQRRVV